MPIVSLLTSLRSRLLSSTAFVSSYGANGFNPELVADFVNQKYTGENANTLTTLIDHNSSTAGNATMTGGYGPELVTNGTFDSDYSGWTTQNTNSTNTITWNNGAIDFVCDGSVSLNLSQSNVFTVDKAYELRIDATVNAGDAAGIKVQYTGTDSSIGVVTKTGSYVFHFVAGGTGLDIFRRTSGSATNVTIDNISVREVPKIQWRPHNLLSYSEDLTGSAWATNGTTQTVNEVVAPDGATTADKVEITTEGSYRSSYQLVTSTPSTKYTLAAYIKKGNHNYVKLAAQARNNGSFVSGLNDITVDLTDGSVIGSGANGSVTSVGSDWYLVKVFSSATPVSGSNQVGLYLEFANSSGSTNPSPNIASGSYFYAWGAHLYRSDLGGMADVPTSERVLADANTYVRTAGREVSGIELVTNGTFDTDTSGWTDISEGTGSISWNASGYLNLTTGVDNSNEGRATQAFTTVVGKTYVAKASGVSGDFYLQVGTTSNGDQLGQSSNDANNKEISFTATATTTYVNVRNFSNVSATSSVDNISVKEIDVDPSTARYLPRIRHHVYNGSQWVNEGLLHESKARINLVPYSEDLSNSAWTKESSSVAAADDAFGLNMWTITDSNSSAYGIVVDYITIPADTQFTGSILVKKNDSPTSQFSMRFVGNNGGSIYVGDSLNVDDGTLNGGMWTTYTDHSSVEDWGTHWKLNVTGKFPAGSSTSVALQLFPAHNNTSGFGSSASTGSHVVGGIQVETGSVASSYIPTSGSTVTRAAETLTIEHENLPWSSSAVSIAMEGRVNYFDTDGYEAVIFNEIYKDSNNELSFRIDDAGADVGKLVMRHRQSGTDVYPALSNTVSEGMFSPFNVSYRATSTEAQVAADGITTANASSVAGMPDAEEGDMELGKRFMGTISSLRMWANDIADAGIVEATEPSTEPTLSLSFDGTDSSFIDFEWSE